MSGSDWAIVLLVAMLCIYGLPLVIVWIAERRGDDDE